MDKLEELDKQALLYLNNLGCESFDSFWLFTTEMNNWFPLYGIIAIFIFYKYSWKKALLIVIFTVLGITASDQLCNFFKYTIGRPRPCHEIELYNQLRVLKDGCGGRFGFVSAHASNHMFFALFVGSVIQSRKKWFLWLLVVWAIVIGYSRIYIGVHYPLDVIGGFVLGTILAIVFLYLFSVSIRKLKILN